jgi:hypothetical protein
MSQIDNDNVYEGLKNVFSDDNIHLSLYVVKEKVKNFSLYMSSTLRCDSSNGISKRIMGYSALPPTWAT